MRHRAIATLRVALVGLLVAAPGLSQTTYTVVTADNTGPGSLRQALLDANAGPGADVIDFNLPPGAPLVITVGSLPAITDPVTIDATTQPGYDGAPVIGVAIGGIAERGLSFQAGSAGSTLRGLAVYRDLDHFSAPSACVELRSTTDVSIEASHIGLTLAGEAQGCGTGVRVLDSPANRLGGLDANDRLVVSGNGTGILIAGSTSPSSLNLIQNVYVGTDPTGQLARPNTATGILLGGAGGVPDHAAGTQIVDSVISGNGTDGHSGIRFELGATGSRLDDSIIGLTVSGNDVLGNGFHGVEVATAEVVLEGNTIGGNVSAGVLVDADDVTIRDNRIGTDPAGEAARPNGFDGIYVTNAAGLQIVGNTISGNEGHGVRLVGAGTTGAALHGNRVGTTTAGDALLPNAGVQIVVVDATDTAIGGTEPGQGNLVGLPGTLPGGLGTGIAVVGDGAVGNAVRTPVGEALLLMYENAALDALRAAIDLGHDGPTPPDPGDADDGPNGAQNHPDNLQMNGIMAGILEGLYRIDSDAPLVLGTYLRLLVELEPERGGGDLYRLVSIGHDTYSEADHSGCGSPPCLKAFTITPPVVVPAGALVVATATDADGNTSEMSDPTAVVVSGDAVPGAPPLASLRGAHPTPFTDRTAIRYDLPRAAAVRLTVSDLLGREVAVLVAGPRDAGRHEADLDGARLAPGVYVYRLQADGVDATGRLVRTR